MRRSSSSRSRNDWTDIANRRASIISIISWISLQIPYPISEFSNPQQARNSTE